MCSADVDFGFPQLKGSTLTLLLITTNSEIFIFKSWKSSFSKTSVKHLVLFSFFMEIGMCGGGFSVFCFLSYFCCPSL